MNGKKKLKKLIYTKNCMKNCKISILGSNLISDSYAAIFVFVKGIHNETENEILSIRTL
jgi:hypothetical protein